MSRSGNRAPIETFQFSSLQKHWHDGQGLTRSLGCQGCIFRKICGGLQVEAAIFDCLTYCRCADRSSCDNVCQRNAPHHVARTLEVRGLEFDNVLPAPHVEAPSLPLSAPLIYHNASRARHFSGTVVLSLYEMFSKTEGSLRFSTRRQLLDHFKLSDETQIILSGTQEDFLIERWWKLANREKVTRGLVGLGIAMITTPNYSLFGDVPRLDNLFNMKRIALVWSEIQREGMPCALHLNARTDRDFERWTEFLRNHSEISHVAFEFGTGAGSINRIGWHVTQLVTLAKQIPRPLHLILRGGINEIRALRTAFAGITFIDTGSFVKAQNRQRLVLTDNKLISESAPTPKGYPIDDLFEINVISMRALVARNAGGQ